ncbi:GntR family transcriptional regulator [Breznakia blatticola]|uniref:GntR family transcriptional regulator n=1 Tax=Breznakia blatticola TaxID=1754012 RepID=A0A4R8A2B0_9FIRM|nr:GntR family transcriptional regulator [Breznakia blatticola]TDW24673.1 GntR family transcriptional regulator [Breznakia blatticola]
MDVPVYKKIQQEMLEMIKDLPPNSPIPSERDLTKRFDASRMTVRKAVSALVDEGYLYRDSNRGTFVADSTLHKKNTLINTEDIDSLTYKMIYFDVKASSGDDVQAALRISDDEPVVRMIRLVSKNEVPQCIEEIYIRRLNLSDEELRNLPNWKDFNRLYSEGSLTSRFKPVMVPPQYAHMLAVRVNEPIILVENIVNRISGEPVIFMKVYNNPAEKVIEIVT